MAFSKQQMGLRAVLLAGIALLLAGLLTPCLGALAGGHQDALHAPAGPDMPDCPPHSGHPADCATAANALAGIPLPADKTASGIELTFPSLALLAYGVELWSPVAERGRAAGVPPRTAGETRLGTRLYLLISSRIRQ
jgi:hypothetical protein